MMSLPDHALIDRFRDAVAQRFGLDFDEGKRPFLGEILAKQGGRRGADAFVHRMLSGETTPKELQELAEELTVGETYFFRHSDQLRAFTDAVLAGQRSAPESRRHLRILSAGCASGEEAYSLAIFLREHVLDSSSWDLRIVGVDINPASVAKATRARYTQWSLRGVPEHVRLRYFQPVEREYQLDATIRAAVSFEEGNLLGAPAFWRAGAFDVIFCRNVLMYFTPEAARAVIARFTQALAPEGLLFLGPAETLRGLSNDYHLRHAHDAFYYQRRAAHEGANPSRPPDRVLPVLPAVDDSWVTAIGRASDRIARLSRGPRPQAPAAGPPVRSVSATAGAAPAGLLAAREMIRQERYTDALSVLGDLTDEERRDPDARLLRAVSHTNCGQVSEAERLCHEVLAGDELNAEARYILALCLEHAGDYEAAMEQDQTAVYLDPRFAMPHLHLGLLGKRVGNREEAQRAFRHASALLLCEDAARVLLFGGGFSRETLVRLCEAELRAGGGGP